MNRIKKKWDNLINRLKERLRHTTGTGGGPPVTLTTNDQIVERILGVDNPALKRVPGSIAAASQLQLPKRAASPSVSKRTKEYREALEVEVLELTKEKFMLERAQLKKTLVSSACQTATEGTTVSTQTVMTINAAGESFYLY